MSTGHILLIFFLLLIFCGPVAITRGFFALLSLVVLSAGVVAVAYVADFLSGHKYTKPNVQLEHPLSYSYQEDIHYAGLYPYQDPDLDGRDRAHAIPIHVNDNRVFDIPQGLWIRIDKTDDPDKTETGEPFINNLLGGPEHAQP
jgi:hypothetical protein